MQFITATKEFSTFDNHVPAPYIRKSFVSESPKKAKITIAACGFYELYFNGKRITKGRLAPYISNTDFFVYCDQYEVDLQKGENVIALLLGNGLQNNPGGWLWKFDEARFRSAPKCALKLEAEGLLVETDQTFKTHPSPIRYDDYRYGEMYDANCETDGWNSIGFDDSAWQNALLADTPLGEIRLCEAESIVAEAELEPVAIWQEDDAYIYDFGINNAGVCRMTVEGEKGQKIELIHGEALKEGKFQIENICCERNRTEYDFKFIHKDVYICKGGKESYTPTFTYHGFRYVKVTGLKPEQATKDLLRYIVLHSDLETRGGFTCSDETANKLQEITRRSDISCFHYFPTDCPQREKNGWTADAALSSEHILLNFAAENSFREWQRNICKSQNEQGALPGYVPTVGGGFKWGNGPAWDCVLVWLPYYVYMYRGETAMITESADYIVTYLNYMISRKDEQGLVHFGLGDWCHAGRNESDPKAPLEVTDSITAMLIAERAAFLFGVIGKETERDFALKIAADFKKSIRENLIDFDSMTVRGDCQTSQAMGIYYNVFEENEKPKAFERFLELVHEADDHIDCGVLGGRIIFHLLTDYGYADLAYKMITRKDFPSYGFWLEKGATTLWEAFYPERIKSCNHHFWGDISAWFIKCLAGINYNPNADDIKYLEIKPNFVTALENASAYHLTPYGKVTSEWKREGDKIKLSLTIPQEITAKIILPKNYTFANGEDFKPAQSGEYIITKR